MICPLCRKRPAKRACPALGQDICTVCCATKRLVEIQCTDGLPLPRGRAAASRRGRASGRSITTSTRADGHASAASPSSSCSSSSCCSRWCSRYKPEGLARLVDADVALAAGALAGSLETASKGVIFEEATASLVAEGLRRAMKPVLDEITKNGGSRAEREVGDRPAGASSEAPKHEGGHIPDGDDVATCDLVRPGVPAAAAAAARAAAGSTRPPGQSARSSREP